MTPPILRLIFASALVAAGVLCWAAAGAAAQLAVRHERLATLQSGDPIASSRWTLWLERIVTVTLRDGDETRSLPTDVAADYWAGRYDAVGDGDAANAADDVLLLSAANAGFRRAQREAGSRPPSVERLDQVLQAYAAVLKNGGFNRDAAYNFEFVARLRDSVARTKAPAQSRQTPPRASPPSNDDLPSGPTVHGTPGAHPPNIKGEEFEILTPMDYGEREAQPEATPGRPLPRKG